MITHNGTCPGNAGKGQNELAMTTRFYLALLLLFLHCTCGHAQIGSNDTTVIYQFDTDVTVTATAATSKTPVTYTNLSRAQIQERNLGQDAPYLLKWTPSVVVASDAGTGTGYTGIWIRGSDPTRTNVTINGVPYNDSESQGVFWVNLPDFSNSADGIQIQRGVGTSTNGAGAFGATIDFNTTRLETDPKLNVQAGLGSFGTQRGAVSYTSGLMDNGLKIDARYSKIHSDGYVDRAFVDQEGYYAGLTYVFGEDAGAMGDSSPTPPLGAGGRGARGGNNGILRFVAFGGDQVTYQAWNGITQAEIDQFGRTYNSAGTEKEGEPYDDETDNYRQNHYQLHYDQPLGQDWKLGLKAHYTRGRGYFEQYKANQNLTDYGITSPPLGGARGGDLIRRLWLDNHFYGTVYSLRYRPSPTLDFTFGGSANEYLGDHFGEVIWARNAGDSEIRDRYYENDATKRDFSNFLRTNWSFANRWNAYADLQLRHVNYEFLGVARDLSRVRQDVSLTFFNPKAGLLYDLKGGQVYASFGVAQREPNRNDYVNNPSTERPEAERLYNTEIGLRRTRGRFNYAANFYHMYYRDQLVLTGRLNDVGEYVRANVPESYRLGLELQGGADLGKGFTLGGNLTLSRNRVVGYTEFVDEFNDDFSIYLGQAEVRREDTPLAFSPDVTGAVELGYAHAFNERHGVEAGLQVKYVGDRYVDNSGAAEALLPAYYYADLRLAYDFRVAPRAPRARLTLLVRNLTDQLYFANGWGYRFRAGGEDGFTQGLYPQAGANVLAGLSVDF